MRLKYRFFVYRLLAEDAVALAKVLQGDGKARKLYHAFVVSPRCNGCVRWLPSGALIMCNPPQEQIVSQFGELGIGRVMESLAGK